MSHDHRDVLEAVYPPQQFFDEVGIGDHKVYTGNVQERTDTLNRLADAIDEQHEPLWQTKNGRQLRPSEMHTQHIENALAMLKRAGYVGPSTVRFYISCPLPHGDMAMVAFDQECEAVMDAPVSEFVDIFENILEERKEEQV